MKKFLCLLLALTICLCCFSACKEESDSDNSNDSPQTSSEEEYDLPPISEIEIVSFVGYAAGVSENDTLKIKVSENNRETLGETATVKMDGLDEMDICDGDELYISIDRIEGTTYFTIHAKKVELADQMDFWKPVIYLYPEKEVLCSVKVELNGKLTCTYPNHGEDGWQNFTALPDGTLISPDGKEYYCLYWEGRAEMIPDFSKGFCVKGEDTADFLSKILPQIGLTPREANEFIIYWLPQLQSNEYNLISFQSEAYTDVAELLIDPAPDSLLRVYMVSKPLDNPIEIEPQEFDGFVREGFTVVEWGGSILE